MGEKTLSSAAEGGMAVDLCAGMCQIDTKKKKNLSRKCSDKSCADEIQWHQ